MKSIQSSELKNLLSSSDTQLIDIREPYETNCANIGGLLIPMAEIQDGIAQLNSENQYVIMCQSGKRAAAVANFLEVEYGFKQVYVLEGGFEAYAKDVDNTIEFC
jgi:rhodanese-related sulfurtransferase